jgi:hypothetical protein
MHDAHELAETSPKNYDTQSKVKKNGGKVKRMVLISWMIGIGCRERTMLRTHES